MNGEHILCSDTGGEDKPHGFVIAEDRESLF